MAFGRYEQFFKKPGGEDKFSWEGMNRSKGNSEHEIISVNEEDTYGYLYQ